MKYGSSYEPHRLLQRRLNGDRSWRVNAKQHLNQPSGGINLLDCGTVNGLVTLDDFAVLARNKRRCGRVCGSSDLRPEGGEVLL